MHLDTMMNQHEQFKQKNLSLLSYQVPQLQYWGYMAVVSSLSFQSFHAKELIPFSVCSERNVIFMSAQLQWSKQPVLTLLFKKLFIATFSSTFDFKGLKMTNYGLTVHLHLCPWQP